MKVLSVLKQFEKVMLHCNCERIKFTSVAMSSAGPGHEDDEDIQVDDFSGDGDDNMDTVVNDNIAFLKTKMQSQSQ